MPRIKDSTFLFGPGEPVEKYCEELVTRLHSSVSHSPLSMHQLFMILKFSVNKGNY